MIEIKFVHLAGSSRQATANEQTNNRMSKTVGMFPQNTTQLKLIVKDPVEKEINNLDCKINWKLTNSNWGDFQHVSLLAL